MAEHIQRGHRMAAQNPAILEKGLGIGVLRGSGQEDTLLTEDLAAQLVIMECAGKIQNSNIDFVVHQCGFQLRGPSFQQLQTDVRVGLMKGWENIRQQAGPSPEGDAQPQPPAGLLLNVPEFLLHILVQLLDFFYIIVVPFPGVGQLQGRRLVIEQLHP